LTEELVNTYGRRIKNLNLRPSSGGAFEVVYNGTLIFSKKALDRLPEDGEITTLIEANR
jgi:selenoprotein W-related protein